MKKLYSTPAMEVKSFEAEDIMTTSSTLASVDPSAGSTVASTNQIVADSVQYNTLFGIE